MPNVTLFQKSRNYIIVLDLMLRNRLDGMYINQSETSFHHCIAGVGMVSGGAGYDSLRRLGACACVYISIRQILIQCTHAWRVAFSIPACKSVLIILIKFVLIILVIFVSIILFNFVLIMGPAASLTNNFIYINTCRDMNDISDS